jgi:hypothetical protein
MSVIILYDLMITDFALLRCCAAEGGAAFAKTREPGSLTANQVFPNSRGFHIISAHDMHES